MTKLASKYSLTLPLVIRPLQRSDSAGIASSPGPVQQVTASLGLSKDDRPAAGSPSGRTWGRNFRRSLSLFCCLAALASMDVVMAQAEAAQRTSEEGAAVRPSEKKESPPAMIRAFIVPADDSKASLQLVVKPQKAEANLAPQVVAATDGPATFGSNYDSIKPGGAAIELRSGDKVLAGGSVALKPARAYTFVAWQTSSADWQIKAFPDDPTTPNAADRAVRVLNFPAGLPHWESSDHRSEGRDQDTRQRSPRVPCSSQSDRGQGKGFGLRRWPAGLELLGDGL